ncbi:hypothetical protein ACFWMR_02075 [Amycolatopsis thailandensis]|uniref:hypothetical protein n=1 Tax=Amycolatopsis thailandensis TaxID=589330 RepID=UPI00364B24FC
MDVQGKIQELEDKILAATAMRDAQRRGDDLYEHFQTDITRLTTELLAWQAQEARLEDIANQIRLAKRGVREAERDRDYGGWTTGAAKVFGVFGGLLLIIALLWPSPPALLVVVCIGCLLVAGGAVLLAARSRRGADQIVLDRELELELAESSWRSLAPDGKPFVETTKAPARVGAGAFEDEDGD